MKVFAVLFLLLVSSDALMRSVAGIAGRAVNTLGGLRNQASNAVTGVRNSLESARNTYRSVRASGTTLTGGFQRQQLAAGFGQPTIPQGYPQAQPQPLQGFPQAQPEQAFAQQPQPY
jgi:hypothetical protein